MAVCSYCDHEMIGGPGCTEATYKINDVDCQRIPFGVELDLHPNGDRCHDCATPRGGLHHPGCDGETCPSPECIASYRAFSGGRLPQAISCGCDDPDDEPSWV